ncbi:AAA family ATPase [Corynebacterium lizhenjunii]|uniref:AAA family ATPase n=1 Tax=Corynebacterium lizhenjunii TaxID=2709394 RepID=A0A7T0KG90_9CORY|nr:AAA family ATPase [Corynebacterium lizhenjunii]QPK79188.1 AAA family ATPase [Corynebacterium lizhenjunii]
MVAWRIGSLELRNFRNYESLELDFEDRLTVLTGKNGAGKTSILDALKVILSIPVGVFEHKSFNLSREDARIAPQLGNNERVSQAEPHYPVSVGARLIAGEKTFDLTRTLEARGRTKGPNSEFRKFCEDLKNELQEVGSTTEAPILAAYGVERLVKEIPKKSAVPTSRLAAYENVLDPRSDLNQLSAYIEYLDEQRLDALSAGEDPDEDANIRQLKSIFDSCNEVLKPTGWGNARWDRKVKSVVLTHEDYGTLPLSFLATGTKICAGLALDIATRMGRLNPHLSGEELRKQTPGIVLIDEVDMHLHPEWQRKIIDSLLSTFPAVQFIVSTHSPLVISSAPTGSIRILDNNTVRTPEFSQGLKVEKVINEIQGADPNPDTPNRELLSRYMEMVHAGDGRTDEARKLRERLENELGGIDLVPELADADAYLFFDEID